MKIGIMNNPSKSIYDEAAVCGKAGFDFLDLTIEGPCATNVDIAELRLILDSYSLFITGHTDPYMGSQWYLKIIESLLTEFPSLRTY